MKQIARLLTGGLALILAACSKEPPPPVYQAVPVTVRDIVVSASAAGVVEPVTTVEVKSKASGEIIDVRVETGDVVRAGQLLVKVDPRVPANALRQAEADLEVAKAQLANAQSQLRRAEELFKTQSITEQEYEAARLQAANANAQLVRAERALEDARIAFEDTDVRAPTDGVIISKAVEVGTVIASAISQVTGGTTLLTMANLDTVQVRALVDETDIGKIQPGMDVTITVDAFPNRPFRGSVLKIEPQAVTQQNVTMFPVLVRIPNPGHLLKPGMNAEVEVHVGSRQGVLAIPNAALRTQRDVGSAALVLGLDPEAVQSQIAEARRQRQQLADGSSTSPTASTNGSGSSGGERIVLPDGREVPLPPGITAAQVRPVFEKMRSGGFQALSSEERALLQRLRGTGGPGGFGRGGQGGRFARGQPGGASGSDFLFGGEYIVFVLRQGKPAPVLVRTGLTDLDYSEVVEGLSESDTVLLLPSASLVAQQQEFNERMQQIRGNAIPGIGGGGPQVRIR
ncbi:Macrolide export protein MacA [bacterium HR33]|nr:Macrolide export protein MacA [bacterium HR33]